MLKVNGKGINSGKSVGDIPGGTTKMVTLKLKLTKPGKAKLTFKVTSDNAGGKTIDVCEGCGALVYMPIVESKAP